MTSPSNDMFCAFDQMHMVIETEAKYGFLRVIHILYKNYSAQVLKANMRIVGTTEHAVVLYRDKLPNLTMVDNRRKRENLIKGTEVK